MKKIRCPICHGSGKDRDQSTPNLILVCQVCKGKGMIDNINYVNTKEIKTDSNE